MRRGSVGRRDGQPGVQGRGRRRLRSARALLGLLALAGGLAVTMPGTAAAADPPTPSVRYDDLPDFHASFATSGAWDTRDLTYWFESDTADIDATSERNAILDAFSLWSRQTPLRFSQAASADAALITIKWTTGDHGDGSPFDGTNGVLAHTFYPPPTNTGSIAGDVHFDEDETWTTATQTSSAQPIDLVTVAAHELGHALGLQHSTVSTALMTPFYTGSHRWLDPDDIAGIRSLYTRGIGAAAWVLADQPSAAGCYTPATAYQLSPNGFTAQVCRTGTGVYQWQVPRLLPGNGNVQVSAFGGTGQRCKVVSWGGPEGGPTTVNITCFTMTGVPADAVFEARFQNQGPRQPLQGAYLWSSNATASSTPPAAFSWNSFGGTNTVTRTGVGSYTASLPGFTRIGGTVHVTAYGSDNLYCKVQGWGVSTVNVLCFTPAGAPADSRFTLVYTRDHLSTLGSPGSYGWTQSTDGTISTVYSWHSGPFAMTAVRNSTGVYTVTVPGVKPSASTNAHVTAYGFTNHSCQVGGWSGGAPSGGTLIQVLCFRPDGTPGGTLVDSQFTVSYLADS